MSTFANATLSTPGPVLMPSQNIPATLNSVDAKVPTGIVKISMDSESDSESDTFSDEDDSSDDDKQVAENPVLKERLKQLDRYATPMARSSLPLTPNSEQVSISNMYTSNHSHPDTSMHNGVLSHGKSSGPSEIAESCSTLSEYRSHQLSVVESPNNCSGPASLNNSVTPKHNFSPPYVLPMCTGNSGPSSQHDQLGNSQVFHNLSNNYACKGGSGSLPYNYGSDNCRPRNDGRHEFTCEVCQAIYSNRSSLQSHMKKHFNYVVKRHQCDQCPYSTQYGKNLFKHIESMHTGEKPTQFRCEGCCRCFPTEALLQDHECLAARCNTYRCDECGRVFKTKLRLKYHADIHNPRKPYVCDMEGCDRAFRTPKYLKNHRDEFHRMQPKNYICPVECCDLIFHRKTHLKRHIATHDEAEKKYHCQWPNCQRRFCSEETLNLHYRKHTGEKPFNCALCPYSCYNKPSLNEHYRLQHAKDSNVEGPYKSFDSILSSSAIPRRRLATPAVGFTGHHESSTLHGRTSTPISGVRHRMADILESCGAQQPGPMDAEINGILDSLDKESDLPDLFNSNTFDFEHSNPDPPTFRSPNIPSDSTALRSDRSLGVLSLAHHDRSDYPTVTIPEGSGDCSLTSILTNVLAELQHADSTGLVSEFDKAKSNAVSALPTFSTGQKLDRQISAIVDQVLEALVNRSGQAMQTIVCSATSFTREESYMVESLEHQLLTDSPLSAPCPPRRRGRRPKLQQQLQPYLERIFSLESGSAEAMASYLVAAAQRERGVHFYDGYYQNMGCVRTRGRARGCRIRGRSGRPLSLTLRLLPDGTATRTHQTGQSLCRNPGVRGTVICSRRIRGGIRGRYRIDRPLYDATHTFAAVSDDSNEVPGMHNSQNASQFAPVTTTHFKDSCVDSTHDNLMSNDLFETDATHTDDAAVDASVQLRAAGKSCAESDEELDDLEELDDGEEEAPDGDYDAASMKQSISAQCEQLVTGNRSSDDSESQLKRTELSKVSGVYQSDLKKTVSQDTLGEMLEDLGVIVKRIGERAATRKRTCLRASPTYHQSLKPADYSDEESQTVGSVFLNTGKTIRNPLDAVTPTIQLPSMATLASVSAGTPASTGGSTPRCLSSAELHAHSPRLSSVPASQPPALVSGSRGSHTPLSDVNTLSHDNTLAGPTNLSGHQTDEYKSSQNELSRTAPMWSCESMCCPTTRDTCTDNLVHNNTYSPMNSDCSSNVFVKKVMDETPQNYHPTDLRTRISNYTKTSDHSSPPISPKPTHSPLADEVSVPSSAQKSGSISSYSAQLSSNAAAMGSFMSAVEAVDHLRSLSALGAKYTASLGMSVDDRQDTAYHRLSSYQYPQLDRSPRSGRVNSTSPSNTSHPHDHDRFGPPTMPSALNSLFSRDRKCDNLLPQSLGLSNPMAHCGSPTKPDLHTPTISGQLSGAYSPYHPNTRGRNDLCGDVSQYPLVSASATSACSSASSSSSSARSYFQELYHQREHQYQEQQQPLRGISSPAYDLTTRQLLTEAAATAYAHGLGRCDGQSFMTGLHMPQPSHMNHSNNSPRASAYAHQSGPPFPSGHCSRYHHSEANMYPNPHSDIAELSFHANDFGGGGTSSYMVPTDPYAIYQEQLRQTSHTHTLSRSMEHAPQQTAAHLAHSIHEVSGLAAAEAAAAAAYAYHQYHQHQAHRHGLSSVQSSNTHYPNLLNAAPRGYYPGQLEEHFTPRDLALYTNNSERRDPKTAYLAENFRGSQAAPGRFLF